MTVIFLTFNGMGDISVGRKCWNRKEVYHTLLEVSNLVLEFTYVLDVHALINRPFNVSVRRKSHQCTLSKHSVVVSCQIELLRGSFFPSHAKKL